MTTPISFFIPSDFLPAGKRWPLPKEDYWRWRCTQLRGVRFAGVFNWTVQTYGFLKESGFPCRFVDELPSAGIIVAHRQTLAPDFRPTREQFLVCIKPDRLAHPFAQMHIIQNPRDPITRFKGWGSHFIPYWPQAGLIPRKPSRRDRFRNIAYLGNEQNLSPDLKQPCWRKELEKIGLEWRQITRFWKWHDYADIDAVVALRSPEDSLNVLPDATNGERLKPASKLHNAWLAGVPAILGRETAYRAERRSSLDYIEASSWKGVLKALRRLQSDPGLRRAMIQNGRLRSAKLKERSLAGWKDFLVDVAAPAYAEWRSSARARRAFMLRRYEYLANPSKYFWVSKPSDKNGPGN